ncbi:hypothetical protein [Sinisalibacter lacisalsi]|uniref:Uncharacterized protein n=1 Tax=Sinisalibacter lacisalsi TaxID=1526570 RepID=A0ABQ1QUL9_9RHOB|nr:hypothetical protein [Sinisalibacter lacisalsi]GGD43748.1 hypothetical protein GCM10011358_29410 [Sinisalibacter lacisalsi]
MIRALAVTLACAQAAAAGPVAQVDPESLALAGRMDFEALPLLPEPGLAHDAPLTAPGLALGARFAGQAVTGAPHDRLEGAPRGPLALAAIAPGQGLATAWHAGFGSTALFPLGPAGFPVIEARGEGAVALLFEADVRALALKIHADYADPLGTRPPPGTATLTFHDRAGGLIDRHHVGLAHGVLALGFASTGPGFAGVTITNDDPGGIAIDDIRYPLPDLNG